MAKSERHISPFKNGLKSLCLCLISSLDSWERKTTMSGCNSYNNFNSLQKSKVLVKHVLETMLSNEQCLCFSSQGAGPVRKFHCPCAEQDHTFCEHHWERGCWGKQKWGRDQNHLTCCIPSCQVSHFFLWITYEKVVGVVIQIGGPPITSGP